MKINDEFKGPCCVFALLLLVMPFVLGGCYGCSKVQVADGYRDSTVRKLSETGLIWKTWEVETLGDGMRATTQDNKTTLSPETFQYTVTDPKVVEQLRDLAPGKRVRVHYRKNLTVWSPNGESRYFITGIEDLP